MVINKKNSIWVLFLLCVRVISLNAFIVRVCLDEGDVSTSSEVVFAKLHCKGGFVIEDYQNTSINKVITKDTIILSSVKGMLHVNGKKYFLDCVSDAKNKQKQEVHATSPYIRIKPIKEESCLCWNGNRYDGDFVCVCDNGSYVLTNWLDSELYVAAVLNAESYGKWGLEVNKAFAVMCRTYLMHTLLEARAKKKKKWYDIRSTNAHQTYHGTHDCEIIWQAVAGTSHIIMGCSGKPILAMYDVCCGGVIPALHEGINFVQQPCLARRYGCDHCSECKLYRWRATSSLSAFEQRIKKELSKQCSLKGSIQSVTVVKADAAGGVKEVLVKGCKGTSTRISGKQMYAWFKQIKSQVYTVKKEGDEVIFEGKGYGHHFGLCQWGARAMINSGTSYRDTLRFYYPGITFMKIEVI